jgi:hypothetical protein
VVTYNPARDVEGPTVMRSAATPDTPLPPGFALSSALVVSVVEGGMVRLSSG